MTGFIREHIVKRVTRSPRWPKIRKAYLKLFPRCAVCGKKKGNQVHHFVPFHLNPALELVFSNLITLCPKHHLIFGHLGWWKSWNVTVVEDCKKWAVKYIHRPHK